MKIYFTIESHLENVVVYETNMPYTTDIESKLDWLVQELSHDYKKPVKVWYDMENALFPKFVKDFKVVEKNLVVSTLANMAYYFPISHNISDASYMTYIRTDKVIVRA